MDLAPDPSARHLAKQKAQRSRLLFGASHGCFNAYLRSFKKRDEEMCCYCDFPVDTAEHALFVFAKWGMAWRALSQAVGAKLTPYMMVPLMLQSERLLTLIESFVTLVMNTRELDGRRDRKNGEG